MQILKSLLILWFLTLMSVNINAQDVNLEKTNVYDFNHFNIEFQSGSNRTQFLRTTGVQEFKDRLENIHLLTAGYQFNFGPHFGLQINGGFGLQPKLYSFDKPNYLNSNFLLSSRIFREYSLAFRLGMNGSYHCQFKDSKWGMDATLGGAVSVNTGGVLGVSASRFINGASVDWYDINTDNIGDPIGILTSSIGITRELENRNLLGLYIASEYFFSAVIVGDYFFAPNTSTGNILNNGSNIGLKLRYSFTSVKKKDDITELTAAVSNARAAKQAYKRERRNTNVQNIYVTAGTGIFLGRNINRGDLPQIRSNHYSSWNHFVRFEKGTQNNYFMEGSVSIEEYYAGFKMENIVMVNSNDFVSTTASLGYGKKLIRKKTNWNFLTLSFGAAASYRMDFIENGNKNGTTSYGIPYEWNIESEGRIDESPLFFSLYTSLTHDIRLFDRWYLSLNYRFHQGLNTTVSETVRFTANPGEIDGEITRRINGTSSAFNVGLKFRL